jgi:hypothetical protein
VGKAGKKNTTTFEQEPALEEARDRLGWLHRLGFLNDDDRVWARNLVMRIEFPESFRATGGIERLREYLLRLLDEKRAAPGAKKGRPSNKKRDYWIVRVLARLVVMCNVPLTRSRRRANDVRPRPGSSACAIVAQVLQELGIKLNEAGVEAVWSKRRPQLTAREIDKQPGLPRTFKFDPRDQEMIDARLKADRLDIESAR